MFAILAAVVFGLALILDWADATLGDAFTWQTLITLGLLFVALHLAFEVGIPYPRRRPPGQ